MAKSAAKALSFWAYLTLAVALLALLLSPLRPRSSHHSWLLNLPDDLRLHYSNGSFIKLHFSRANQPTLQIFAVQSIPEEPTSKTVLLLHGLAASSSSFRRVMGSLASSGIRSIAIDLPGSGFSDPVRSKQSGKQGGVLGWLLGAYTEIKEKGIFWGFDQLVETGEVPVLHQSSLLEELPLSELLGGAVAQVFDVMSLREPVHLVIHDSSWAAALSWVSANRHLVSSITFLDSSPGGLPAFPYGILEVPVLGNAILRSRVLFGGLLRLCCYRGEEESGEGYRVLVKDGVGKREIVEGGKGLNYSFNFGEWFEGVKEMKFQVLWSNNWSDKWIDEGRRIAAVIPTASFGWHSGGRWPQVSFI